MTRFIPDSQLPDCTNCRNSRVLKYGDGVVQCRCTFKGKALLRSLDTTIGRMYSNATLATLTAMDDEQAKLLNLAERFTKHWEPYKKGLYLWSEHTGNGKSLVASAVINHFDMPSQAIEASMLWDAMRSTYDSDEPIQRYLNVAMHTPALLLDDLGMGNTEKADEWLTDIINARIERGRLTVITSNMHPSQLPKASARAISRIMAHCHPIRVKNVTDWRVKLSDEKLAD